MDRIILHIDFDSFFASVEQQDNPSFRGKPIGVTATNGRTAVIAASREAKKYGVKNVTRTYTAWEICPTLTIVPAHFYRYLEISKAFLRICTKYSPTIELFSIDEVFMDVTKTAKLFGGVYRLCQLVKSDIKKELGDYITVSIGISYNKLLAKLASGIKKPNGMYEITPENVWGTYAKSHLTDICGIGERIARRLNLIGIYTLLQLRDVQFSLLKNEFGNAEAQFLYSVGQALDTREVVSFTTKPEVKSISRNFALPHNEYDMHIVTQNIFELCEEIARKLRRLNKTTQTVGLYLSGNGSFNARKTVTEYMDSGKDLFSVCQHFIKKWDLQMVRMISIWVGNLHDKGLIPHSLFDNPKVDKLQKTIDAINEKFGYGTLRNGFVLDSEKLPTVPNGYMADKYERTKLAEETA